MATEWSLQFQTVCHVNNVYRIQKVGGNWRVHMVFVWNTICFSRRAKIVNFTCECRVGQGSFCAIFLLRHKRQTTFRLSAAKKLLSPCRRFLDFSSRRIPYAHHSTHPPPKHYAYPIQSFFRQQTVDHGRCVTVGSRFRSTLVHSGFFIRSQVYR